MSEDKQLREVDRNTTKIGWERVHKNTTRRGRGRFPKNATRIGNDILVKKLLEYTTLDLKRLVLGNSIQQNPCFLTISKISHNWGAVNSIQSCKTQSRFNIVWTSSGNFISLWWLFTMCSDYHVIHSPFSTRALICIMNMLETKDGVCMGKYPQPHPTSD